MDIDVDRARDPTLSRLEPASREPNLTVEDVMTSTAICCQSDTSLHAAAALLWDNDIGALPVLDGTGARQVCAMITDRDIAIAAYTQGRPLHELSVRGACTGPARSCRPSDDLERALEIMAEAAVRRLVVVDAQNHPLGVISISDIARAASSPGIPRPNLESATCRTLSAITSPERDPVASP